MSIYDNFSNWRVGNSITNSSNWNAAKHSSLNSQFDEIQDSIARSNEYGAPGHGYQGTMINGQTAVSREEAEAMTSSDEYEEKIAEALGQGITRRGGNS